MKSSSKKAFTMIELIFVIVIIGILAAVAIPKLAATRDDAKISNIVANTRIGLGDVTALYTAQGSEWYENNATTTEITNIVFSTAACAIETNTTWYGNSHYLCDAIDGNPCIEFDAATSATALSINAPATPVGTVCQDVKSDIAITAILLKDHKLGGSIVKR